MNIALITLVVIAPSLTKTLESQKAFCDKMGIYCNVQCQFGNNFQKEVCLNECLKNKKTCVYIFPCQIPRDATNASLLNPTHGQTVDPGDPCFFDYAQEYFCRHVYNPCKIACKNDNETCNICENRRDFCECGLGYYLNREHMLGGGGGGGGSTLRPPTEGEDHTAPSGGGSGGGGGGEPGEGTGGESNDPDLFFLNKWNEG